MSFGACNLSIISCRAQPSDKSELVTQLLFGEHFEILEKDKKWSKVRIAFDNYECWIDNKQYIEISKNEYANLENNNFSCSLEITDKLNFNNLSLNIVIASSLPNFDDKNGSIGGAQYKFTGKVLQSKKQFQKSNIADFALLYLNAPYLWGGRSPFGIDCSGFVQMVYKLNGIKLPRDSHQQAELGEVISFIEEVEPGDLAFFDNEEGNITHLGIILEDNRIIHASGKVRIDQLDHQGIFNVDTQTYSHKLRVIKRVI